MNKLENYLITSASKLFGSKNAASEWKIAFIIISIILLITCFISIYSSFEFFQEIISPLLPNVWVNVIVTFIILVLIESLTQISLIKFWRFTFKGNIIASIVLFIISAGLYGLSWYTSCNGMAIKEGKKVDNKVEITSNFSDKLEKIETEKNEQIKELLSTIKAIKNNPEGWGGGVKKATILSASQRKEIDKLYNRIESIKKQALEAKNAIKIENSSILDNNSILVESTESKYYNIVAIIMIIQIICNASIMFIQRVIDKENKEMADTIKESAIALKMQGRKLAMDMITNDIQGIFSELNNAYSNKDVAPTPPTATNTDINKISEDQKKKITPNPIQKDWEFLN
jgi:hypothetical protein